MKKRIIAIATCCLMTVSFTVGAYAASNLQSIQAYLNKGVTVKYNGVEQSMTDANGNRVYPITYNGTTYLPARSVSKMLGVDVTWDGTNNTVGLGTYNAGAKDFIRDLEPYAGYRGIKIDNISNPKKAGATLVTTYAGVCSQGTTWDLEGKYSKLTFSIYNDESYDKDVNFWGDNGILKTITVEGNALPKTYTVNVSGVHKFDIITSSYWDVYMFDATIQ